MILRITVMITYLLMIGVNWLANALPLNGITTGAVSDSYPNLFAPAGVTFAIWGVIYALLGAYSVYTLVSTHKTNQLFWNRVNSLFIVSSCANSFWIVAWHYRQIGFSVVFMLLLLLCLVAIAEHLRVQKKLSLRERTVVAIPFGIYFGWITIATIANITAFLVAVGWNGLGMADEWWMIVMICVGTCIGIWQTLRSHIIAYGLVFVWAYGGIILKHSSSDGFNGQFPAVIAVTSASVVAVLGTIGYLLYQRVRN